MALACAFLTSLRFNVSRSFTSRILVKQQVRNIPRWTHRRPVKVMFDEDRDTFNYEEKLKIERESIPSMPIKDETFPKTVASQNTIDKRSDYDSTNEENEINSFKLEKDIAMKRYKQKEDNNKTLKKSKKERKQEIKSEMKKLKLERSAAEAGVPVYTKLGNNDSKLSKLMTIAKSKNKKLTREYIVLEGKRLINDAIQAGFIPEQVFFSRVQDAADVELPNGIEVYKVPYKTIELWSDLTTPPGLIAFLKTPNVQTKKCDENTLPLTIVCDSIRDPGNLGTILRGAAGAGCEKIILMKGCVDLWEPKVLRSGAGAHFRTAVVNNIEWENVDEHLDKGASVFLADSCQSQSPDREIDTKTEHQTISLLPYFAVDYFNCGPIVLIIGGETEGLSIDCFKFAHNRNGIRLNIPLSNQVESLNSGVALAIIAFEIRRQMSRIKKETASN